MWQFFEAVMAFRLIDEMFAAQRNLQYVQERERRNAIRAARQAIGIKKSQLWQQVEALKQTGNMLSQQYQQTWKQIDALRQQPRTQKISEQAKSLYQKLKQIQEQQASLKNVRQQIHERVATLKAQGLQLSW